MAVLIAVMKFVPSLLTERESPTSEMGTMVEEVQEGEDGDDD